MTNKTQESKLVAFKLISGETIIAEFLSENETTYELQNIVAYYQSMQGVQMSLLSSVNNNDTATIQKDHVMFSFDDLTDVSKEYYSGYLKNAYDFREESNARLE